MATPIQPSLLPRMQGPATALRSEVAFGREAAFDHQVTEFAAHYAAEDERDHRTMRAAIAGGRITAQIGA